ncbi:MAG: nitroreductase family protein [Rikenellaceae bacterium]
MKNSWQILTLLLAVALVVLTFKSTQKETNAKNEIIEREMTKAEVGLDLIFSRSSVRSYTDRKVSVNTMELLLQAGMAAPTAGNRQPWRFVVVSTREILDSIPAIIPGAHMAAKSQHAIVVCGLPSKALVPEYWVQDCSAATENILLAAHAMGLGAVWCGAYPNNAEDKVGRLQKLLSLPEDVYPLSVVVFGYPDSEPNVKDKWDPEKVFYR